MRKYIKLCIYKTKTINTVYKIILLFQLLNGKTSENKKNVRTLTKIKENEKSTFTVT